MIFDRANGEFKHDFNIFVMNLIKTIFVYFDFS